MTALEVMLARLETTAVDDASVLLSRRCNVYVANLEQKASSIFDGSATRRTNMGQHDWVMRALHDHPWRVADPANADVVYINASFSQVALGARREVEGALDEIHKCRQAGHSDMHCAALGLATPMNSTVNRTSHCRPMRFVMGDCHQSECAARLRLAPNSMPIVAEDGSRTTWLKDFKSNKLAARLNKSTEMIMPFVVHEPAWLVAHEGEPPPGYLVPWEKRKLLFFAGHVPNPFVFDALRFHMFTKLVGDAERATVASSDVYMFSLLELCGNRSQFYEHSYEAMGRLQTFLGARCERWFSRCQQYAQSMGGAINRTSRSIPPRMGIPMCDAIVKATRELGREPTPHEACHRRQALGSPAYIADYLRKKCSIQALSQWWHARIVKEMKSVMARHGEHAVAPTRYTQDEYLRHAFSHKFCLVSIGDDPATHKLAEVMAIAGKGGCLPLFAHPGPAAVYMPYWEHVDYCSVGFVLWPKTAVDSMPRVLNRLERMNATHASARHRAAAALHRLFVMRDGATMAQPSAAHYVIAAMCARARLARNTTSGCAREGVGSEASAMPRVASPTTPPQRHSRARGMQQRETCF